MTYQELVTTDDLAVSVPTKLNENARMERFQNVAAKSATFTAWDDDTTGSPRDIYLVTTAAATIVANLPTALSGDASLGRIITVMKADAGAGSVTLDPNASETINGAATVSLASQYHYRTLVSNGTEWFVLSSS